MIPLYGVALPGSLDRKEVCMTLPKREIERVPNAWRSLPKKKPSEFPKGTEFIPVVSGRFSVYLPNHNERFRRDVRAGKLIGDPEDYPDAILSGPLGYTICMDKDYTFIERKYLKEELTAERMYPFTWGKRWFARDVPVKYLLEADLPE